MIFPALGIEAESINRFYLFLMKRHPDSRLIDWSGEPDRAAGAPEIYFLYIVLASFYGAEATQRT